MKTINLLPAILIGGPPNVGKSILFYSLTRALERRNLPSFYALRAAPDGEGHWSQEVTPDKRFGVRFKGTWNQRWIDVTCRDLAARAMPMLVDVGGLPTEEQEVIFDQCNYAILLTHAGDDNKRALWRQLMGKHGLPIIADLQSDLEGYNLFNLNEDGSIGGTLAGLRRELGCVAQGAAFDALVERVFSIFNLNHADIDGINLAAAPKDSQTVDYKRIAYELYGDADARLPKAELDRLVNAAPAEVPLAVYGAKPSWLCTALGARRNVAYIFDVRQGWVKPPAIHVCSPGETDWQNNEQLDLSIEQLNSRSARLHLRKKTEFYYLDYDAFAGMRFPHFAQDTTLSLYGPMPMWLFASLGHAYRHLSDVVGEQVSSSSNATP